MIRDMIPESMPSIMAIPDVLFASKSGCKRPEFELRLGMPLATSQHSRT